MIPIENQLTALELSKKLRELGVKQEGCLWWWLKLDDACLSLSVLQKKQGKWNNFFLIQDLNSLMFVEGIISPAQIEKHYSAFMVAECLEILDEEVTIPKGIENVANFLGEKIL